MILPGARQLWRVQQITFGISRMAHVLALVCVAVVAVGAWASCDVSMSDFGAVGDGVQYDDAALQAAFGECPNGVIFVFPAGKYLLSPFNITSNMQLYL
jgi:polygalacturonase